MNLKVKIFLIFTLVVLCPGSVQADKKSEGTNDILNQFKREETNDILNHLERKIYPKKKFIPIKLGAKKSFNYKLKSEEWNKNIKTCQAEFSIEYLQFITRARVDATIDNNDCAASSGQYNVRLLIIDENGDTQLIKHVESWARDNDTQYESRIFYDIGNNVELFQTTTRGLTCVCTPKGTE